MRILILCLVLMAPAVAWAQGDPEPRKGDLYVDCRYPGPACDVGVTGWTWKVPLRRRRMGTTVVMTRGGSRLARLRVASQLRTEPCMRESYRILGRCFAATEVYAWLCGERLYSLRDNRHELFWVTMTPARQKTALSYCRAQGRPIDVSR